MLEDKVLVKKKSTQEVVTLFMISNAPSRVEGGRNKYLSKRKVHSDR